MANSIDIPEPILSPAQLWPGGIPTGIGLHPNCDLDEDDLPEQIRGWCAFLKSYHSRGPTPNLAEFNGPWARKRFACLVDKPYDPDNYSRITKLLILLYIHLQKTESHPLSYERHIPNPQLPSFIMDPSMASSASNSARLLAPENLPVSYFLETADFDSMAMTRTGTVVFPRLDSYEYVVIDNQSLQDGLLCLLNFAPNGEIAHQTRIRPFRLGSLMSLRHGLGHTWSELISERPEAMQCSNEPIDLNPPLLAIMTRLGEQGDLGSMSDYTSMEWAEEFERFAPGYLAYELEGRTKDYSWDRLVDVSRDPFVTYNHFRYARKLAALQGRRFG